MSFGRLDTPVPPPRLLDYGPNHSSVELNHEEYWRTHLVIVTPLRFAMADSIDVVR